LIDNILTLFELKLSDKKSSFERFTDNSEVVYFLGHPVRCTSDEHFLLLSVPATRIAGDRCEWFAALSLLLLNTRLIDRTVQRQTANHVPVVVSFVAFTTTGNDEIKQIKLECVQNEVHINKHW